MVTIEESIMINAPLQIVFDAERNISIHESTQDHRAERAIAGVTSGLINLGEEVEWEAVHFGIKQRLRVKITDMEPPNYFRDEMIFGAFKSFSHEHHFQRIAPNQTLKKDIMLIEAPFGFVGRIAEISFLESYMRKFIQKKNESLKSIVENFS